MPWTIPNSYVLPQSVPLSTMRSHGRRHASKPSQVGRRWCRANMRRLTHHGPKVRPNSQSTFTAGNGSVGRGESAPALSPRAPPAWPYSDQPADFCCVDRECHPVPKNPHPAATQASASARWLRRTLRKINTRFSHGRRTPLPSRTASDGSFGAVRNCHSR